MATTSLPDPAGLLDDGQPPQFQLQAGERRVSDPTTGAQKGQKLARFDLIPPKVIWELAEHYGKGSLKYADRNWEGGFDYDLSIRSLESHFKLWQMGEEIDAETGSHHLIAVIWHAAALRTFLETHPEKDTRPKNVPLPPKLPDCGELQPLFEEKYG